MAIGERLKQIRDYKGLSQGDIERRTGMLRCYVSRVEQATQRLASKPWKSSLGL
jgi:transcriptional regulator with XRE-family HTH domain